MKSTLQLKNSEEPLVGYVIGTTPSKIFIAMNIIKVIKYTQEKNGISKALADKLKLGDVVSFELSQKSTPTKVEIVNLQYVSSSYKEYIDSVNASLNGLPTGISYPRSKVVSMSLFLSKELNPYDFIPDFTKAHGLCPIALGRNITSSGVQTYEDTIILEQKANSDA